MKTAHLAPIAVVAAVLCLCEPGSSTPVRVKRQGIPDCHVDKDCGPHARCVNSQGRVFCACEIGYIVGGTTHCTAAEGQNTSSTLLPTTTTVTVGPNSSTSKGGVNGAKGTTKAISKCSVNTDCGQHGLCVNVQRVAICACDLGYIREKTQCTASEVHTTSSIRLEKESTTLPSTTTKVTIRSTSTPTQGDVNSTTVLITTISKCSANTDCGQHGLCVNVQGGDICACELGYTREQSQCTASEVPNSSSISLGKESTTLPSTTTKVTITSTSTPTEGVVNSTTVLITSDISSNSEGQNIEPSPPSQEDDNGTKSPAKDGASEPGELIEGSSYIGGHFIVYVTTVIVVVAILYIGYQYRAKVTAFVLEGKNKSSRKRAPGGGPEYHKITDNVEDTMPSLAQAESVKNYVY